MKDFTKDVTVRIVEELNIRKIKQVELFQLCEKVGMPISQPDISKIYLGKKAVNLYQCAAVCKALKLSMDSLLWGEDGQREDFCNTHCAETLHTVGRELEDYVGEYGLFYLSTALDEDKILNGKIRVMPGKEYYELCLSINTGVKDMQGKYLYKNYVGRILVSSSLGVAYFLLKSESIGEVCLICLRHRNYSIKTMECRVGLVLTTSAGEMKEPTAHRCLLIRGEMSNEQVEELRPWLRLNTDSIQIEKNLFEKVIVEMTEKYPDYAWQLERSKNHAITKNMVNLSAEVLRKDIAMQRGEFVDFLTLLYKNAELPKNYKVSSSDDTRVYEKVSSMDIFTSIRGG